MATYTQNYNLVKPDLNETADIEVINNNMGVIDTQLKATTDKISLQNTIYQCTGTANTYSITMPNITSYTDLVGVSIIIKINVDSTEASTININDLGAKSLKKPNGVDITNLKANGVYTIVFDGTNFQLQGEGGDYGAAAQNDVKVGVTFGTETGVQTGTYTSDATALAGNIDSGLIAYGNGQRLIGTSTKRQWAIVTATSSMNYDTFWSRFGTIQKNYLYYTGLPFTPSIITLCATNGDYQSYVNLNQPTYNDAHWIVLASSGACVQLDGTYAYISGNTLRLPVDYDNSPFTIMAIE